MYEYILIVVIVSWQVTRTVKEGKIENDACLSRSSFLSNDSARLP